MDFDQTFIEMMRAVRKAILTAYGSGGNGILITRKSPKEMFITKSGREILETFKGHHPFLDLIIASIKDMTRVTGEGAKRTFLTIDGVIRALVTENRAAESFTRQELVVSLMSHIPDDNITLSHSPRDMCHTVSPDTASQDRDTPISGCNCPALVTLSVMSTLQTSVTHNLSARLPTTITDVLIPLLVSFLRLHVTNRAPSSCIAENMSSLGSKMPSLVTEVYNRPVFDSSIGEGVIIQPGLTVESTKLNFIKKTARSLKMVLFNNLRDETGEANVIVQCLGADAAHIKHHNSDHLARIMGEQLRGAKVDLVIALRGLDSRVKQEIKRNDIAIVEHIGEQEFKDLVDLLRTVPWTTNDSILAANICQAVKVEAGDLGGQSMLRLLPEACPGLHHLVVCGATRALASQYSRAMVDSIRSAGLLAKDLCTKRKAVRTTCHVKDPISKAFEDSIRDYDMNFDSETLREAVRGCVMSTILSLVRIERICYTTKRIVKKRNNRVGFKRDSTCEDDSQEE